MAQIILAAHKETQEINRIIPLATYMQLYSYTENVNKGNSLKAAIHAARNKIATLTQRLSYLQATETYDYEDDDYECMDPTECTESY